MIGGSIIVLLLHRLFTPSKQNCYLVRLSACYLTRNRAIGIYYHLEIGESRLISLLIPELFAPLHVGTSNIIGCGRTFTRKLKFRNRGLPLLLTFQRGAL